MTNSHEPQHLSVELSTLNEFLDHYRSVLIAKASGISDEQAKSHAVEPSNLSILGLLRHMAEVERHWFRRILKNESELPDFYVLGDVAIGTADGDFEFPDTATLNDGVEVLQRAITESRLAIVGLLPDELSLAVRPKTGAPVTLRWIMIHMIEEYARHCGHADFLRERIDGRKGDN